MTTTPGRSSELRAGRAGRRLHRSYGTTAAVVALTLGATSCAASTTQSDGGGSVSGATSSTVSAPLESSVAATGAAWANIPMGRIDEPANTFWQAFVMPAGASRWALATPPGVADNGGLVSALSGSTVITGFEASQLLHFSPLASTSNEGTTWAPGILDSPLATEPDALAESASGQVAALVGTKVRSVMVGDSALSGWRLLVSTASLTASAAGRACGVQGLTAVAYSPGGQLVVGASCSRPGTVGVFQESGGGWMAAGPSLPGGESTAITTVLRLRTWGGGVSAVMAARLGKRTVLLGSMSTGESGWSAPAELSLTSGQHLGSSGISADGGVVVVLDDDGGASAHVLLAGSHSWAELPGPPTGTAAVAFEPNGEPNGPPTGPPQGSMDALTVHGKTMTVYRLEPAGSTWRPVQKMEVPLQYGSSS